MMTLLTTVVGMLPLALALGEGAEMLQTLAIKSVARLLFSTLVSLLLVPAVYRHAGHAARAAMRAQLRHRIRVILSRFSTR